MSATKKRISDDNLEHIVLNDIKEMDKDVFAGLVEYLYCVKVTANEDESYTIENEDEILNLEDVFGDNIKLFDEEKE